MPDLRKPKVRALVIRAIAAAGEWKGTHRGHKAELRKAMLAAEPVWEVWQGDTQICSSQMRLTEAQARNKVENERRRGLVMEARPSARPSQFVIAWRTCVAWKWHEGISKDVFHAIEEVAMAAGKVGKAHASK